MTALANEFSDSLLLMRKALERGGLPSHAIKEIGLPADVLDRLFDAFLIEHPGLAHLNRAPGGEFRVNGVRLFASAI